MLTRPKLDDDTDAFDAPALASNPVEREVLHSALAALDHAEALGHPAALCEAHTDVGHAYRRLGATAVAEWYLQQSLRWTHVLGTVDATVDITCELAEMSIETAETDFGDDPAIQHCARERARDLGFDATQLAAHSSDPQWEVSVLMRVSEVLDRCGDHEDAIALQCRALSLITGAYSSRAPSLAPATAPRLTM